MGALRLCPPPPPSPWRMKEQRGGEERVGPEGAGQPDMGLLLSVPLGTEICKTWSWRSETNKLAICGKSGFQIICTSLLGTELAQEGGQVNPKCTINTV